MKTHLKYFVEVLARWCMENFQADWMRVVVFPEKLK